MDSIYCSPDPALETQNPTALFYVPVNRTPAVCTVTVQRFSPMSTPWMLVNCGPLNAAHSNEENKFLSILYQFPQSQLWILNNSPSRLHFPQDCFTLNTQRILHMSPVMRKLCGCQRKPEWAWAFLFSHTGLFLVYTIYQHQSQMNVTHTHTAKGRTQRWVSHRRPLEQLMLSTGS